MLSGSRRHWKIICLVRVSTHNGTRVRAVGSEVSLTPLKTPDLSDSSLETLQSFDAIAQNGDDCNMFKYNCQWWLVERDTQRSEAEFEQRHDFEMRNFPAHV